MLEVLIFQYYVIFNFQSISFYINNNICDHQLHNKLILIIKSIILWNTYHIRFSGYTHRFN